MRVARTRRYRAAFVGLGAMGSRHARAFARLADRFELAGAYDVRADALVPQGLGLGRLRSADEAIDVADVVVVATPSAAHGPVAVRALAAGRHVLVEKPLSPTLAEAADLCAVASRGCGRLFVGHSERFNPAVRVLSRLVRDEPVLALDLLRVGPCRPADGGVLVNLGVHDFDLAAYLGGAPLALRGAIGGTEPGGSGEDLAHVLFTTAAGAAGHLYVDRTATTKRRQVRVVTAAWVYEADLLSHDLVRTSRTSRTTGARCDVPLPTDEPLACQAAALADALDGCTDDAAHADVAPLGHIATGEDGMYAVALAECAASLISAGASRKGAALTARGREKLVAPPAPLLPKS